MYNYIPLECAIAVDVIHNRRAPPIQSGSGLVFIFCCFMEKKHNFFEVERMRFYFCLIPSPLWSTLFLVFKTSRIFEIHGGNKKICCLECMHTSRISMHIDDHAFIPCTVQRNLIGLLQCSPMCGNSRSMHAL